MPEGAVKGIPYHAEGIDTDMSTDSPAAVPTPGEISELTQRIESTAERLAGLGTERRRRALAAAAGRLLDASTPIARRALKELPDATGLSPQMVQWALRTSLASLSAPVPADLAASCRPHRDRLHPVLPRRCSIILAGNVFTAGLAPIAFALTLGIPAVCKASSRDDVFPRLLRQALGEVDPEVAEGLAAVVFPGGSEEHLKSLLAGCDLAVVYGGDETIRAVRSTAEATTRLIEHGHGLGIAYAGAAAVSGTAEARKAAARIALDVAAYDQRGCLSPMRLWVKSSGGVSPRRFARLLHEELERLDEDLPRGPLPTEAAAAQMQWRAVAVVRGELMEGRGHAVAWTGSQEIPLGPGRRNIQVVSTESAEGVARRLGPLGIHLKAIGAACDEEEVSRLRTALPRPLCPRIVPAGTMQTPPLTAYAEGAPPREGWLRWISI